MEELKKLRYKLHQIPEISGNEKRTSEEILAFLNQYPPSEVISSIGGNGILALFKGEEKGKSVLFRCELDALPIEEINIFQHKSIHKGVSHKCGHDGHMSILCGLARKLFQNPIKKGTVGLLFQPAEENGNGAAAVISDSKFEFFKPDYAFALHNLPGFPLHQIIIKENAFTCAVNSIIIKLKGKTAHAAEPENGINPALAISEIINHFNSKIQPDITLQDYCVITPIYIAMGEKAYGVSAGYGEVHFTLRSDSNLSMKQMEKDLTATAIQIALQHNLQYDIEWTEKFQANENDSKAVDIVRTAAKANNLNLFEKDTPFTFGEDFGLITQHFKGAMFGIGAGEESPSLHNPDYDFPDEITDTGIQLFYQITKEIIDA